MLKGITPHPDGHDCVICNTRHGHPNERGRANLRLLGVTPRELILIENETVGLNNSREMPHPIPITPRLSDRLRAAGMTEAELEDLATEYDAILQDVLDLGTAVGDALPTPYETERIRAMATERAAYTRKWKHDHPEKAAAYAKEYRARLKAKKASLGI